MLSIEGDQMENPHQPFIAVLICGCGCACFLARRPLVIESIYQAPIAILQKLPDIRVGQGASRVWTLCSLLHFPYARCII
jgi:hypothetical protein